MFGATAYQAYLTRDAVREATRAADAGAEQARIAGEALAEAKNSGVESVRMARESLRMSQRPWLTVPQVGPLKIEPDRDIPVVLFFKNSGRLPASAATIKYGLEVAGQCGESMFGRLLAARGLAAVAADAPLRFDLAIRLTAAEAALVEAEKAHLCIYGVLAYTDALKTDGFTRWCIKHKRPVTGGMSRSLLNLRTE